MILGLPVGFLGNASGMAAPMWGAFDEAFSTAFDVVGEGVSGDYDLGFGYAYNI